MITKASQRGGGSQLASHLMNAHDNERVEIAETRGCVAKDLHGAFKEWHAQSIVTHCTKYLYSLSVNPDQRQGRMTREEYFAFLDKVEKKLGLAEQGRIVVFHAKKDKDGIAREHCHAVWSRIDARRGRAITISFDRMKRVVIARAFAKELGRTVPKGMEEAPGDDRFSRKASNSNLAEMQQQERSGISKEERRAQITEAWQQSKDGPGFAAALQRRGYVLARGGRLSYAVVDRAGEVHGLSGQVQDVRSPEIKARLSASHPLPSLPSPEQAQEKIAEQREKLRTMQKQQAAGPSPDERRAALQDQQQERRQRLAEARAELQRRHAEERQGAHKRPVLHLRQQGPRRLMERLSQEFRQHRQDRALERRQKIEVRDIVRQEKHLTSIEGREHRSLEIKIRRDEFQHLAQGLASLTPLLDRISRSHRHSEPEKIPATLRTAFSADRPVTDATAEEATRAAERMREQQERLRQEHKPKPSH